MYVHVHVRHVGTCVALGGELTPDSMSYYSNAMLFKLVVNLRCMAQMASIIVSMKLVVSDVITSWLGGW